MVGGKCSEPLQGKRVDSNSTKKGHVNHGGSGLEKEKKRSFPELRVLFRVNPHFREERGKLGQRSKKKGQRGLVPDGKRGEKKLARSLGELRARKKRVSPAKGKG